MNQNVIDFFQMLDDACDALGKPKKSESAKLLFLQIVGNYGIENLKGALIAHLRDPDRGRFVPTPADLIEQILRAKHDDDRPSADEAWATAVQLTDESVTVVINNEIAQAWAVAREVMPDRTGARMAFRSAYDRLVESNRKAQVSPSWFPSLGHDLQGREAALLQAVSLGRLTMAQVKLMLPVPEPVTRSVELIAHTIGSGKSEHAQKYLSDLLEKFGSGKKIG